MREAEADLGEAAALLAAEAHPVDAPVVTPLLLRLDALADQLRLEGVAPTGTAAGDAALLADALGGRRGFVGHGRDDREPADSLLDHVLDRRRGLPIALTVVYVALGRRLGFRVYPIALPGHVVAGVAGPSGADDRPVVIDPFDRGAVRTEAELAALVDRATGGQLTFHRAMLRPAPTLDLVRRMLNNLTHDYAARGELHGALWTVECKQALPGEVADDDLTRGRLLEQLGRYDEAAQAFTRYVAAAVDAPDRDEVRRAAVRARARTN